MDKTKIAVNMFNKWAVEYQEKFMNMEAYKDILDLFCTAVKKENATVLDVACGPGNITKYILKKRPDLKVFGTDLAPKMLELAKQNNPTAEFQLMDCRDIDKIDKKYDAIACSFCLPYLSREEAVKFIQDAANVLNDNGVFYLSTMEDDYSKSGFKEPGSGGDDKLFIYYHEVGYLTGALKENGFEIIRMSRKENTEQNETDLLILAKLTHT